MSLGSIIPIEEGRFNRKESEFRDRITADGGSGFPAEPGRYHLIVAWACPWAHRTLIARKTLGLEDAITTSVVHPVMDDQGAWRFDADAGYPDRLDGFAGLQDVYQAADPDFAGVGTVPVLWDKRKGTIVNNESREILRMLDTEFAAYQKHDVTFLPAGLEDEVDAMIDANYETVNNGVYKAGFAETQDAYEEAVEALFDRLDELEEHLGENRYLLGDVLTEADWCLFPTLFRFDLVYHYHFKCNIRRLSDMPNLWGYTRELYQYPGIRDTIDIGDTKKHYFMSHPSINPHRVVPVGPELDLDAPHGRGD